jgi:carbon storage regulator
MLVLSRQTGERVIIDGNIEVTIVEIRTDRVKLGIVAPPEVAVHREEVFRRIVASALTEHSVAADQSHFLPEFA